jgi:hemoglobin-like flavoprotein
MNKPKHQHFIPKSYLNNFSFEKDDTPFLKVKFRNETEIKEISTSNICVKKNLYTLPIINDELKYSLEHFYADNIDSKFPKIYKILTDKNQTIIDINTKTEIISIALSLYFRTPKFLNYHNSVLEKIVSHYANKDIRPTKFNYFGREVKIQKEEVEKLIKMPVGNFTSVLKN